MNLLKTISLVSFSGLFAGATFAQSGPPSGFDAQVSLTGVSFPGELTQGGDDISATHRLTGNVRASNSFGKARIGAGASYEWNRYSDNVLFAPGGGEPTAIGLTGEFTYFINQTLTLYSQAGVQWAGDSSVAQADKRMMRGIAGLIYRTNNGVQVGIMGGAQERIAGGTRFIAFPFIDWQINDRLRLLTRRGPIFTLNLFPTDAVQIVGGAEFEFRQFVLSESTRLPMPVVLQDEGVMAFAGLRLNFKMGFFLEANAVFFPERRWDVFDASTGELLRRDKIDNMPGARLIGGIRF
jgi:hypothetical protein